ncbi:Hypothetical_protein [Hexamita inflata]|uniref:Hypothetical_protein n=1 Tax=Hexamita inflata TaxID=28002 RepID=A0AA86PAB0_9EUKA|nr:Hypothetical protein HINF_LOCUS22423 [Hexamita inflata]
MFSFVSQCSIQFNNIAIVVGNSSKFIEQISQIYSNVCYFGGLITYQIRTIVNIKQVISRSYQSYNTQIVNSTGILLGYVQDITNNISIENACILLALKSIGKMQVVGIIGFVDGNLSIQQIQLQMDIQTIYNYLGMIGYQSTISLYSEVINAVIIFNTLIFSQSFTDVGPLYGSNYAQDKQMCNILVDNSSIGSDRSNGGLIGAVGYRNISLQNVTIQLTNVTSFGNGAGGIFGYSHQCAITIKNSTINSIHITGQSRCGIILGVNSGVITLNIQNSKSIGSSYINSILQTNCGSFSNTVGSVTQC